ncbi:MAG: HU family DNA-binding protein [Gammaproteobacteria bacterium]|nr:HU family DNA-binding protein [Gammaproteobacteria bacterium]
MNKAELIDELALKSGTSKADAERVLNAFLQTVTDSLVKGGDVALIGFGTFTTGDRAERTGRNPQTGAEIKIPAARVAKFKAGKALKDAVNK